MLEVIRGGNPDRFVKQYEGLTFPVFISLPVLFRGLNLAVMIAIFIQKSFFVIFLFF